MNIVSWNPKLECGIPLLDDQHKTFFKELNTFVLRARAGHSSDAVGKELDFLENYLLYHFQVEEAYQCRSEYPNYRIHQAAHKMLSYNVKSCSVGLRAKTPAPEDIEKFYDLLVSWISDHIMIEDIQFSEYYKSHS